VVFVFNKSGFIKQSLVTGVFVRHETVHHIPQFKALHTAMRKRQTAISPENRYYLQ